jgi:gas vesicle protein
MFTRNQNGTHKISNLLAGALLGVTGGLLLAPQSGRRTRRLLKRKIEDYGDDVREVYDRRGALIHEVSGRLRRSVQVGG